MGFKPRPFDIAQGKPDFGTLSPSLGRLLILDVLSQGFNRRTPTRNSKVRRTPEMLLMGRRVLLAVEATRNPLEMIHELGD
jgi:hypothetical protein